MKTIKCLLAGVLVSFSASVFAQDVDADIKRMDGVISQNLGNPAALKADLKLFDKTYKKNAQALAKLARVFYEYNDTANARIYAEKSKALIDAAYMKNKPIACGEAYVVLGDLCQLRNDGGGAAMYYQLAQSNDEMNPTAYERYASVLRGVDLEESVKKLKDLQAKDPTYPADAVAAGLYYNAGKYGKALEHFRKIDESMLREEDFPRYAYIEYAAKKYDNSLRIANLGLQKFPEDVTCNRYKMFVLTDSEMYDEALATANKLFSLKKYKEYAVDYKYYAQALLGAGQADKALEALDKSLALKADQPDLNKVRSDIYFVKGDSVKGLALLEEYVTNLEKATFADYLGLTQKLDTAKVDEATHIEFLKKEDALLNSMLTKFPGQQLKYIYFKRAHINEELDPECAEGLAVPHYELFIDVMKKEEGGATSSMVINAAKYVANYYIARGENEKAKPFVELIPTE